MLASRLIFRSQLCSVSLSFARVAGDEMQLVHQALTFTQSLKSGRRSPSEACAVPASSSNATSAALRSHGAPGVAALMTGPWKLELDGY